ncbi:MAG: hypothetical protein M1818_006053 [Claussenomyces sp. TS43310]|nr:MAG: hypothetical protein M1818_006053 [Claussenomyces sp. TS43310]
MTRNNYGGTDSHDRYLSALLAALPTPPTLPSTAPQELRDLTVDVLDPNKVYTVYRGFRRHNFQVLVERFIVQLRYGCQDAHCTAPTCFTCRRRAAGSRPLRRYNATSARTLACYLASLDNPETHLCRYDRASPPKISSKNHHKIIPKSRILAKGVENDAKELKLPEPGTSATERSQSNFQGASSTGALQILSTALDKSPRLGNEARSGQRKSLQALQEPVKTDHKSFVQNLFNTVAFRMVEWLTPAGLERLATSEAQSSSADSNRGSNDTQTNSPCLSPASKPSQAGQEVHSTSYESTGVSSSDFQLGLNGTHDVSVNESGEELDLTMVADGHAEANEIHGRTWSPKVVRNADISMDNEHVSSATTRQNDDSRSKSTGNPIMQGSFKRPSALESPRKSEEMERSIPFETHENVPQSLSHLPIEVIDIICDFLQTRQGQDPRREFALIQSPCTVARKARRSRTDVYEPGYSPKVLPVTFAFLDDAQHRWELFFEQSLFFVLSQPKALIRSFRDGKQRFFDTQTISHYMMRLSRAAWPLLFDSLWIAAGDLYTAPRTVRAICDRSKTQEDGDQSDVMDCSDVTKADLMYLCLHALIAAGPQIDNLSDLVAVSRNRSNGPASLHGNSWSRDHLKLSLLYDDAFSDALAQRLARRIFAAIPVTRQYQELLRLNAKDRNGHFSEPDILSIVLATFTFHDIDAPPFLDFSLEERELYWKRALILLLDWARTIMLQEWKGGAEVPTDGAFGGALTLTATIYERRKVLSLPDVYFRADFFADRLNDVDMPVEWLSFTADRKTSHLLDHPYLFSSTRLVTYFRAINFFRMSSAYEASNTMHNNVDTIAAPSRLMSERTHEHLIKRLSIAVNPYLVLQIRRSRVLEDAFDQLWRREERELLRPLKIRLGEDTGEEGFDSGGVQQEFFRLAIIEALNPDYGAFTVDEKTRMIWFQPGSPQPLWKFELIGIIVSLALFNGLTLPVTFPKAFYRKLLGAPVIDIHHIADGWLDLCKNLNFLLEWDEKKYGAIRDNLGRTYEFSVAAFGKPVSREMAADSTWPQFAETHLEQSFETNPCSKPPNVRDVDIHNRHEYVSDYIHWLTDVSIRPQFEAFQRGFSTCLSHRSLTLLDPDILQSIVEGVQEIDISELRRYARYEGYSASDRIIREFWSIVKKYTHEEKKRLLEFVTASDRLPVGGMRNVVFVIQKNGRGEMDGHLPTSYTCYGYLLLPEYSKKEILREKLEMALQNSKGFGFA